MSDANPATDTAPTVATLTDHEGNKKINVRPIQDNLKELETSYLALKQRRESFDALLEAVSEKSGATKMTLRKFLVARMAEKDDQRRKIVEYVRQLNLLIDEVGT